MPKTERKKHSRRRSRNPIEEVTLRERELHTRNRKLRRDLTAVTTAYVEAHDLVADIGGAVEALPRPKPVSLPRPKKHDGHVTMVLAVNDWHTGLVVNPYEVQGYGEYNWEIAEQRRSRLLEKLAAWTEVQRNAYRIDKLVVLGLGDLNDGMIHLENVMFNEFSPPKQAVMSGQALGRLLGALSVVYPQVEYHGHNCDNHGRLTKKPMYTGRGQWNFNVVTHDVARAVTRDCPRVSVTAYDEMKVDTLIHDHVFLSEHGNDLRSWMGIPYYGLQRLKQREAERRARAGKRPYDYFICGHWHVAHWDETSMISPALCGTTPYDHAAARYGVPSHMCFMVGKHGWFGHLQMDLR